MTSEGLEGGIPPPASSASNVETMPELRKDPITREWVIVATERAKRPSDFHHKEEATLVQTQDHSNCPFCPGHESATPPEILAYRPPGYIANTNGWSVRVIPNKFSALNQLGEPLLRKDGIYESMPGVGAHEVIIETPEHGKSLARLNVKQVEQVLLAYRDRYLSLRQDPWLKYILIFRNHGKVAGASIEHAHSQLVATPIIPQLAWLKIKGIERYQEYYRRCVYCDIIEQESNEGKRIVAMNGSFLSFAPYASRYPFEMWIMPKQREAHFVNISAAQTGELAAILKETLLRLDLCLDDPPYNYTLLTTDFTDNFHWHIEIVPRLSIAAGFELGTGIYINIVAPEQAASYLRHINIERQDYERL